MNRTIIALWIFLTGIANILPVIAGGLDLAPPFTDHMVLQRGKAIPVWGTAKPKSTVVVEFGEQKLKGKVDDRGKWSVKLNAMKASAEGRELKVSGDGETKRLGDVVVGDVWVATGQSNMRFMLEQCLGGKEEAVNSTDSELRLFNHAGTLHPGGKKYDVDFLKKMTIENYYATKGWQPSAPKTSTGFSGVAYFFGKKLREELKIPIGVINYSVGGSPIEAHIAPEMFETEPVF